MNIRFSPLPVTSTEYLNIERNNTFILGQLTDDECMTSGKLARLYTAYLKLDGNETSSFSLVRFKSIADDERDTMDFFKERSTLLKQDDPLDQMVHELLDYVEIDNIYHST
jgi:hypothetical protein